MQNAESESNNTEATVLPLQPRDQETHKLPRSFTISKDFRPAEVKLNNIEHLEGQHNYEDWASQMTMVFGVMNMLDIVVDGVEPSPNASPSEQEGYRALPKTCSSYLNSGHQQVDP